MRYGAISFAFYFNDFGKRVKITKFVLLGYHHRGVFFLKSWVVDCQKLVDFELCSFLADAIRLMRDFIDVLIGEPRLDENHGLSP